MKGDLLIGEWLTTPWALRREVLATHAQVLAAWVRGRNEPGAWRLNQSEANPGTQPISTFEARRQEVNQQAGQSGGSGLAIIPVYGTIVQRAGLLSEWSGGTSTQQVSAALSEALADETVAQILLEFDSPGGSVFGVAELADEIATVRKLKPVTGIANSLAASAAYWLMSQCSTCYLTPGGEVGSIGVWMAHEDWSAAMEASGLKITTISAGRFKTEGNPYEPLSEDARAFMQSRVDDYYDAFVRAVARGRGVSVQQVRDGMGEGRVLGADAAKAAGMVDDILPLADLIRRLQREARASRSQNTSTRRRALAAACHDLQILG